MKAWKVRTLDRLPSVSETVLLATANQMAAARLVKLVFDSSRDWIFVDSNELEC